MKKLSSSLTNMLLALTGVCLIVSAVLALLNHITAEPIRQASIQAKVKTIQRLMPNFDNKPYEERFAFLPQGEGNSLMIYPIKFKDSLEGYVIESYTKKGFSGEISIMMGLDTLGMLKDYAVLESSETPGLGSKIEQWFHSANRSIGIRQMKDFPLLEQMPLKVRQDGGKVDAITAATISSRAFLDALNRGGRVFNELRARTRLATAKQDTTESPILDCHIHKEKK